MAERVCRKCKRWKGCIGKDWYHFGEIRWCPLQVIWILQNAEMLRAGLWPPQCVESGESRQIKEEGYFVKAILAITEVDLRLAMTDNKGELLVTQVEDGRTLSTLSDGAREILIYVKGRNRKIIDFRRWLREVYYAPKTGEKHQLMQET